MPCIFASWLGGTGSGVPHLAEKGVGSHAGTQGAELAGCFLGPRGRAGVLGSGGQGGRDWAAETGEILKVVSLSKKGNTLGMLRDLFLVL